MRVGFLYHPRIAQAVQHARRASRSLADGRVEAWCASSWDVVEDPAQVAGSELLITFGGDGTLLRAARAAAPYGVACAGVNYGRLGFLTEFDAAEFDGQLAALLRGEYWIEQRILIDWTHQTPGGAGGAGGLAAGDVVVGRGRIARVVDIEVLLDGSRLTTYTADGVIVATPTGSTGYTVAAYGPVLHPESQHLIVTPICPFLTPANAVVASPEATVELRIHSTHEATISIDGQTEHLIASGDRVICRASEHPARYARVQPRNYFYGTLAEKLHWRVPREMPRPNLTGG